MPLLGDWKKPGELLSQPLLIIALSKGWVPFSDRVPKFIIENASADLQQEVGALLGPAHLLFLDYSLAHHLVDGRFHKRCSDGFPISHTRAVVRDKSGIVPVFIAHIQMPVPDMFFSAASFQKRIPGPDGR